MDHIQASWVIYCNHYVSRLIHIVTMHKWESIRGFYFVPWFVKKSYFPLLREEIAINPTAFLSSTHFIRNEKKFRNKISILFFFFVFKSFFFFLVSKAWKKKMHRDLQDAKGEYRPRSDSDAKYFRSFQWPASFNCLAPERIIEWGVKKKIYIYMVYGWRFRIRRVFFASVSEIHWVTRGERGRAGWEGSIVRAESCSQ